MIEVQPCGGCVLKVGERELHLAASFNPILEWLPGGFRDTHISGVCGM
jgi:hypothetical protein